MKIKSRILALLLVVVMCMTTLATTAFAYADDPEDSTIPTEETTATEETEPSDIPPVTETTPTVTTPVAEDGSGFSEDGNLITRDLLFDKNTNKQFITVQTRNGETFYIIIDYDKPLDEEGDHYETYFLNMVDEADIQALLAEAGIVATCDCTEKCAAGSVNTACAICTTNMTECVGKEKEPIVEPTDPTEPSEPVEEPTGEVQPTAVLALVVVIGVVGAGIFFFIKNKKSATKTKGKTDLDNYDYGVDDEDDYAEFESYDDEDDA